MKDITIYDIAKRLGISPTTISRALNEHPAVNKITKQKVFDTATEMGYQSNVYASNLRRQRTNTIGVIAPQLNSHFQSSVMAGMEKVANGAAYNLVISQSMDSIKKEIANAKTIFNSRVDGLLISLAHDTENIGHLKPFFDKKIPVIFYDRVAEHNQCVGIVIDNIQAAYKATTHLIENGCRRIVCISGNSKINIYSDRLKGYRYALVDNNLPFDESYVICNSLSEEAGIEAAYQILKMNPLPDGIFAVNDTCAVLCMKTLKKEGISLPGDIAVVGFNNDPISRIIEPNLTTIGYPGYEMGKVAAQNLINHLHGISDMVATSSIILRAELVVRESSFPWRQYAGQGRGSS